MKKLQKLIIALFIVIIAISCQKEESLTTHERIQNELKSFVSKNKITKCTIKEYDSDSWRYVVNERAFSFNNGFIVVDNLSLDNEKISFNLNYLYSYTKYYNGLQDVLLLELVKK